MNENDEYYLLSESEKELLIKYCNTNIMQRNFYVPREKLETLKEQMKEQAKLLYSTKSKSEEYIEQVINLIESTCSELINNREHQPKEEVQEKEHTEGNEGNIRQQLKLDVSTLNNTDVNLSELYNPDLLMNKPKSNKYTSFKSDATVANEFAWNSEIIRIKRTGVITYTTALGLECDITEYQVARFDCNGNITHADKVFTDLSIQRLSDDNKYKDIVFGKLLSPQNIHAKDSKGYVGEIATQSAEDKEYSIEYVPESYTAVVKLKKALENREAKEDKREDEEK